MSLLDDILADDAANVFASADYSFEVESVTYKVFLGGTSRTFNVQVWRFAAEDIDEAGGVHLAPRIEIFVPRSSTSTVGVTSVDVHMDKVSIATKRGGTVEDHAVAQVLREDAGGFLLLLR